MGLYVGGIPMGFFFDKFGPRLSYAKSAICLFLGYALMWAGSLQKIPSNSIMMGVYMMFVGYGSVAGYMAGLLTNSKNASPTHRGKVTALLVTAFGLSAAIFSQVYHRAFDHDVSRFFWIMTLILGLLPVPGIFLVHYNASLLLNPSPLPSPTSDLLFTTSPDISSSNNTNEGGADQTDEAPVLLDSDYLDTSSTVVSRESAPSNFHTAGKFGDLRGIAVLKTPEFALLFAIVFCCTGVGLTWINIVGSIVKSYRITAIPASGYVIGLSVANAIGRLLFGLLTDLKFVPLPPVYLMIPCLMIIMITHFSMLWITNYGYLLLVTLLTGLSYGGSFAVMPVIINRYFGDKNYGSNLGLVILAVAVGSMGMGAVSGALYDHQARIQAASSTQTSSAFRALSSTGSSHLCYGLPCFRGTYIMTTIVSMVGIGISMVLLKREMAFDARQGRQEIQAAS
jgi:MFS family permease